VFRGFWKAGTASALLNSPPLRPPPSGDGPTPPVDSSAGRIEGEEPRYFRLVKDTAYFVQGPPGPGPGVLLLPSYWGLTRWVKSMADGLADRGHTVLVPDLNFGEIPESEAVALEHLRSANPDRLASLVLSSAHLLSEKSAGESISIVGFGMGGSLALWASVRLHSIVDRAVSFYGAQQIDFAGSRASYLIHLAEDDDHITSDEVVFMQATMGLEELDVETHTYSGTRHGFGDREGDNFDEESYHRAWERTIDFLGRDSG
jgi:carboxymethylenebutenolidase